MLTKTDGQLLKMIAIVIAVIVSSRQEHNISVLDEIIEIHCIPSLGVRSQQIYLHTIQHTCRH